MPELKNILLPTDFSENAKIAKPYAVELARRSGGRIYLIHVFEDAVYYTATAADAFAAVSASQIGWLATARAEHESILKSKAQALAEAEKVEVIPVMRNGHAAHEIVAAASELKADCLVISTHGRTGLSHLFFGSVAERIVRLSSVPVLTVPAHPRK